MSVNLQALDTGKLFTSMFSAAEGAAKSGWVDIKSSVRIELKAVATRIREIGKAVKTGEADASDAKLLMKMVKNNVIAALAMVTNIVLVTAEKIVNAALKAIKQVVNTAIGFPIM
ncbi:MAG: hypothetical protein OQK24_03055 [Magnetovibrio sp.]|nr:hypothetical protein [Magnetovibrio sp.]